MALVTINPTSFTTPAFGGTAVTGASNTGHGDTLVSATSGSPAPLKTCKWTGFQAVGGIKTAIHLKADWGEDGFASPPDSDNDFTLDYSLNGGANWTQIFHHLDIVNPLTGSVDVSIPLDQDLTQVQVRDSISATFNGINANLTASISNIKIEVTLANSQLIAMM